jgi:hypothetical protein
MEHPHPPAPSPIKGAGGQETTLGDPTCLMSTGTFLLLMSDGDSRGSL